MPDKGARTRKRIIHAALQLFSVKGYFHTSISDILECHRIDERRIVLPLSEQRRHLVCGL
jgi:hypothetical protein